METVKQRSDMDCFICCLAMALGRTYEQIADQLGPAFMALVNKQGCDGKMEHVAFQALGFVLDVDYTRRSVMSHWTTVAFAKNMLWGRRALVTLRSMNNMDGWHVVYWNGTEMLDPSTKKTYDWKEAEPTEMWLLNERRVPNGERQSG